MQAHKTIIFNTKYHGCFIKRKGRLKDFLQRIKNEDFSDSLQADTLCTDIEIDGKHVDDCLFKDLVNLQV